MSIFVEDKIRLIQQLAEGLSESESLAYLGLEMEDLSEEDAKQFRVAYKQGRAQFKYFAVTKLKESMSGRTGMQASLAALTRFADEWPTSEIDDHNGVQRTFKIVLGEE